MRRGALLGALVLAIVSVAPPAHADPALVEKRTLLDASIVCPTTFVHRGHDPVLLVHGTSTTPAESWSWNYQQVLPTLGFDVCTVALPDRALGDIQRSAEYVVHAVRTVARLSHRRIDVVGHSQGGMLPRWVLKWWPGLRRHVSDFVGLAPTNHGASGADTLCPTTCAPAVQQQKSTSMFMEALNRGSPSLAPVEYTNIYSLTDELVQPVVPEPTSAVDGASNIMIQDLCPGRPVNHTAFVRDAVVFALVLDALTHRGPADPGRFDTAACAEAFLPGMTAVSAAFGELLFYGTALLEFGSYPPSEEPPLRPYAKPGS